MSGTVRGSGNTMAKYTQLDISCAFVEHSFMGGEDCDPVIAIANLSTTGLGPGRAWMGGLHLGRSGELFQEAV